MKLTIKDGRDNLPTIKVTKKEIQQIAEELVNIRSNSMQFKVTFFKWSINV